MISRYPFENSNLLHIASQFGQLSVNEIIMALEPELAVAENMHGKRPLDLACEYGHESVLRYFLDVHKLRPNMDCLYLATLILHEIIVDMVLASNQFEYTCVSDVEVLRALSSAIYNESDTFVDELHLVKPNYTNYFPF